MWLSSPISRSVFHCTRKLLNPNFIPKSLSTSLAHSINNSTISDSENDQPQPQLHEQEKLQVSPSGVVSALYELKKEPIRAFSLFCELKDCGFQHDVSTYAAIIRILSDSGLRKKLRSIFLDFVFVDNDKDKDASFDISDLLDAVADDEFEREKHSLLMFRVYDALVKSYVTAGKFDEAIDFLHEKAKSGTLPDIFTFNFLLNRLIHSGKSDMSLVMYKLFKQLGLSPNDYTYAIVIKAQSIMGNFQEADGVLKDMEEADITPSPFAYTAYIEGLCVNQKSGFGYQVLQSWTMAGISIDIIYAYSVVIRGFCDEMRVDEAQNVLLDMEKKGIVPDMRCYNALIRGFCRVHNLFRVDTLLDKMRSKGIKINCVTVSMILNCLCELGMHDKVVTRFQHFKDSGVSLDGVCYNIVVDALYKLGKLEEALEFLDEMKSKKMDMDVIHYTTLINGYCCQGDVNGGKRVFKEMIETGLKPDVITCNVLASGLCRDGQAAEALDLLSWMETLNLKPNAVTHNVIIESLCIGDQVKEAEAYFRRFGDNSLDSYSALINGYCKANNTSDAFKLLLKLLGQGLIVKRSCFYNVLKNLCAEGDDDGIVMFIVTILKWKPSKAMCGKIISNLCEIQDMKKAQKVFNILISRGWTPDVITYTIMINSYCRLNLLQEALNLYNDMKERGIKPDIVTFTVLVDGQLKVNRKKGHSNTFDGSAIREEMEKLEIRPDVICYTVFIDAYRKAANIEEAIGVFDEMIERGLQPDTITYAALVSGCCDKRDINEL